jgi:hypothetical protein
LNDNNDNKVFDAPKQTFVRTTAGAIETAAAHSGELRKIGLQLYTVRDLTPPRTSPGKFFAVRMNEIAPVALGASRRRLDAAPLPSTRTPCRR